MKIFQGLLLFFLALFVVYYIAWDNIEDPGQVRACGEGVPAVRFIKNDSLGFSTEIREALLATRFNSLEEFKSVVKIDYFNPPTETDSSTANSRVLLRQCSNGKEISSELKAGINQEEINEVRTGSVLDKIWLLVNSPFAVANRKDIVKIYSLSRRKPHIFGEGDVAFFDLAQASVKNISTLDLALKDPKDSGEKGYLNSFNHITAQAFITSFFSEEMADFLSDVHERYHMPEVTYGIFTEEQLNDPDNYPVDNYVDMINNEWGQEIGKKLRKKYQIRPQTHWTPSLLANYLNDLQRYYSWSYQIGFEPFTPEDEVVVRYTDKINVVMQEKLSI